MRRYTLILIVALFTGLSIQKELFCGLGCMKCQDGECQTCFSSLLNKDGKCEEIAPPHDTKCLMYVEGGECSMCKPGHALRKVEKSSQEQPIQNENHNQETQNQCFKIFPIKNCKSASYGLQERAYCSVCDGGVPASDFLSCKQFGDLKGMDAGVMEECAWGSRNFTGTISCFMCKKGFTVVEGSCVPDFPIDGCMVGVADGSCCQCNPYLGFYMATRKQCLKLNSISKF